MVRLIDDQPDAFAYRSFGRRVLFTGLLVAAVYGAAGTIVMQESEAIMRQTGMDSEGIEGQVTGAVVFVIIVFTPLAGSMLLLVHFLRHAFGRLEVEQGLPLAMLTASRLVFIAAIIVALVPLGLAIDAPITAINFYQERFMSWFFTLVGIGLALVLLALVPIGLDGTIQLLTDYESTNSRRLVTGLIAGGVTGWALMIILEPRRN